MRGKFRFAVLVPKKVLGRKNGTGSAQNRVDWFHINIGGTLVQDRVRELVAEQLRDFREKAAEARKCAASSPNPGLCQAYEELADAWELLIQELESNS